MYGEGSLNVTSWNQIVVWLKQLNGLRVDGLVRLAQQYAR